MHYNTVTSYAQKCTRLGSDCSIGIGPASRFAAVCGCFAVVLLKTMRRKMSEAGNDMPAKKQKLSSDENSNPDLSGDENVSLSRLKLRII